MTEAILAHPHIFWLSLGGLLLAVEPEAEDEVKAAAAKFGITLSAIGELVTARGGRPMVETF